MPKLKYNILYGEVKSSEVEFIIQNHGFQRCNFSLSSLLWLKRPSLGPRGLFSNRWGEKPECTGAEMEDGGLYCTGDGGWRCTGERWRMEDGQVGISGPG